jgi:hypothetical protein
MIVAQQNSTNLRNQELPLRRRLRKPILPMLINMKYCADAEGIELGFELEVKMKEKSEREKRRKIEDPFIPLCHYRICA